MLYSTYEWQRAWLAGLGSMAKASSDWLMSPINPMSYNGVSPSVARALEVFAHAAEVRGKPAFGLPTTLVDGHSVAVTETIVARMPFGQLKHFERDVTGRNDPKVLIVAPMSGHFATLLRGTVERLLPAHDVYITDWRDAKLVPMSAGRFDLNDYVDYVMDFLRVIGPGTNVLAVCQPAVPTYAATALMNAAGDPCAPATLTMMGGPVDTRKTPTSVDDLAKTRPYSWFENTVIAEVPPIYAGGGRKVYPGFLQLAGFLSMNLASHMKSHWQMYRHLVDGDDESADAAKAFYDEYRSVCDLTAEFYLQTIDQVFQRQLVAKGEFVHRGTIADPKAIVTTALLAIEGERDDISGLGATRAALELAENLDDGRKHYYLAEGVGHYGIFNGRKWREVIAPVFEAFIREHAAAAAVKVPQLSVVHAE